MVIISFTKRAGTHSFALQSWEGVPQEMCNFCLFILTSSNIDKKKWMLHRAEVLSVLKLSTWHCCQLSNSRETSFQINARDMK